MQMTVFCFEISLTVLANSENSNVHAPMNANNPDSSSNNSIVNLLGPNVIKITLILSQIHPLMTMLN